MHKISCDIQHPISLLLHIHEMQMLVTIDSKYWNGELWVKISANFYWIKSVIIVNNNITLISQYVVASHKNITSDAFHFLFFLSYPWLYTSQLCFCSMQRVRCQSILYIAFRNGSRPLIFSLNQTTKDHRVWGKISMRCHILRRSGKKRNEKWI